MHDPLRIFIGYDPREPIAYHVLAHSILRRASAPIAIAPLVQSALRAQGLYTRERGPTESTEFSMTRFLVPALCGYKGQALFIDCDMLCLADVAELFALTHYLNREHGTPRKAVHVVQHDYQPTATVKFLGQVNVPYPRKNWSSVMLFDCERCSALTPTRVNILSGLELHRFSWLRDEEIGALPREWNWLVGEYNAPLDDGRVSYGHDDLQVFTRPNLLHYTLGGPWFAETRHCDFAQAWFEEHDAMATPRVVDAAYAVDLQLAHLQGQAAHADYGDRSLKPIPSDVDERRTHG